MWSAVLGFNNEADWKYRVSIYNWLHSPHLFSDGQEKKKSI